MPVVVSTPLGDVEGLRASDGTEAFKGMPFAEPPLGALRFAPAEPKAAWTGTLDAHEYGHQCLQGGLFGSGSTWGEGNEDCLLVNVWRPRGTTPQSNLPVMFFIHGGAFVLGSGGSIEEGTNEHTGMYDGAKLASNGLIIMTINYRLTSFGFMRTSDGVGGGSGGLNGINDQIVALQWARDNVASFGGDPAQITIFGESAGSLSVCMLLVSPLAAGLFRRAIMESGPCVRNAIRPS